MKEIWFLTCTVVAVWLAALGVPDPLVLGYPLNLKLALFLLTLVPMWLFGQRNEESRFRRRRRRYGWWW